MEHNVAFLFNMQVYCKNQCLKYSFEMLWLRHVLLKLDFLIEIHIKLVLLFYLSHGHFVQA